MHCVTGRWVAVYALVISAIAVIVPPASGSSIADAAPSPAANVALSSLSPQRFADTRPGEETFDGLFEGAGRRSAGSTYEVQIAGRGGVPVGASGALINLAAVNPGGFGFFTIFPCGTRPNASALNYVPGVTIANEVVAALSATGSVCVFTLADSDVLIDVVGFTMPTDSIVTLSPKRYADSRAGFLTFDGQFQAFGRAAPGSTTKVRVGGRGDVPAGAAAAIVNVAVVDPNEPGFLTVHACLPTLPLASSINHIAGVNRANELIAELDANGDICIYTKDDVDMIVDVVGFVEADSDLVSVANARYAETRSGESTFDGIMQGGGPLAAGSTTTIPIAGRGDVPDDAVAVVANIAAVDPAAFGFFTFYPCDQPRPLASSLNYVPGVTGANEIVARLDASGRLCLYTLASSHFILDVVGYVQPDSDDPPTVHPDAYGTAEDILLAVAAPGVLGNDVDVEGDAISVVLPSVATSTRGGAVSLAADGSFTYIPPADFFGVDTFEYRATDALGSNQPSTTATVTITVAAVNDAPSFVNGPLSVGSFEDDPAVSLAGWATSIDPGAGESQATTFVVTTNSNPGLFAAGPAIDPDTGDLTFTSAHDANGTAVVTFRLVDDGGTANGGQNSSSTVDVTFDVGAVNDAPSFTKGANVTVAEDFGSYTEPAWATDIESGPADESSQTTGFQVAVDNPSLFSIPPAIGVSGELTFATMDNVAGSSQVTVILEDDGGTANGGSDASAPQTFTISVTEVNDTPVANDDMYSMTQGASRSIPFLSIEGVLGNDADVEDGIPAGSAQLVAAPDHHVGVFTLAADGSFTYQHDGSSSPSTDTFTYRVTDAAGAMSNIATVTLNISSSNEAPVALDEAYSMLEDQTLVVSAPGVLGNDADAEGDALAVVTPTVTSSVAGGSVALGADGSLTYTPPPDFFGPDSFTYQATDPSGSGAASAPATVSVSVDPVNDAPTFALQASPDEDVDEDAGQQTVPGFLIDPSSGPPNEGGQALTIAVDSDNTELFSMQPSIDLSTGDLTYTPATNANGVAVVTVLLSDDGGTADGGTDTSSDQTFSITVAAVNDLPTFAGGGDVAVVEDSGSYAAPWATSVSAGPANESGQSLTFEVAADEPTLFAVQPAIDPSGTLTFTPAAGVVGITAVTVTLTDDGTAGGAALTSPPQTFAIDIRLRGTIVIEQQAVGGDGTFSFDGAFGVFDLTTAGAVATTSFSDLAPGTFAVSQVGAPSDFDLTNITCSSANGESVFSSVGAPVDTDAFEPGDDTSSIDLAPGDTATCRFLDTDRRGSIQIVKDTGDSGGIFDFVEDITENGSFDLISDQTVDGTATFDEIEPGVYEVVETPVAAGWEVEDITCTSSRLISSFVYFGADESPTDAFEPGDVGVRITLGGGDDVVRCTFTNLDLRGTITVVQNTQPTDPQPFDYTPSHVPFGGPFTLTDGETASFDSLLPGDVYGIAQHPAAGWTLIDIACTTAGESTFAYRGSGGPGDTDAFEPGDDHVDVTVAELSPDIVCTFTNTS